MFLCLFSILKDYILTLYEMKVYPVLTSSALHDKKLKCGHEVSVSHNTTSGAGLDYFCAGSEKKNLLNLTLHSCFPPTVLLRL